MWQIVPYLIESGATSGLRRLLGRDGPRAIRDGVFTALLALAAAPPLCLTVVENPTSVHEALYYIHMHNDVPPNRYLVDEAMGTQFEALCRLARRSRPLRRQMCFSRNWTRRREHLTALIRKQGDIMRWMRRHEFTWRLVFQYL